MPASTPSPPLEHPYDMLPVPHVPEEHAEPAPISAAGAARKGILALVDQALVSGARFATSILVGRYCGEQPLGNYALGFSLLLIATCIQEALITGPYTVMHFKRRGEAWSRYNGSVLVHVVLLSLLSALGFGGAWWVTRSGANNGLPVVLGCLAIATPFALLREFARRVEFAQLRLTTSVLVDGSVAIIQVGMLAYLAWQEQLSAGSAVLTIAASSALAGLLWLWTVRRSFHPNLREIWADWRDGWRLGRWMFLAQLTGLIHLQGMLWLIAAWLNPSLTGLFAACSTLVQFINPFALGLNNFISPMTVQTVAQRGLTPARKFVGMSMLLLFSGMLLFTLAMAFGSDTILSFILPKSMPVGQSTLIFILGLNLAFNAAHMVNDGGLWAIEKPQVVFYSSVVAVTVTGIASFLLIPRWELVGAAMSLLLGRVAAAGFEAFVFFVIVEPSDVPSIPSDGEA